MNEMHGVIIYCRYDISIEMLRVNVTPKYIIMSTSHVARAFYFRFGATLRIRDSLASRLCLALLAVRDGDCTRRRVRQRAAG